MYCPRFYSMLFAIAMCATLSLPSRADDWPNWRGPDGTGKSAERNLPTEWSPTKNVRWRVALPERGNSTPIVWSERIFLTQAGEKDGRRTLMCFDRSDGKQLWRSGTKYTSTETSQQSGMHRR